MRERGEEGKEKERERERERERDGEGARTERTGGRDWERERV